MLGANGLAGVIAYTATTVAEVDLREYLLFSTSCDGTLATTVTPTTDRMVCNNTLVIALNGASNAIWVPHNTGFDADAIKSQLGIAVSQWDHFMHRMKTLSERKVKGKKSLDYFLRVQCGPQAAHAADIPHARALKKVQSLYEGQGRGAELTSAEGNGLRLAERDDRVRRPRVACPKSSVPPRQCLV